ncbi:MAG: hypothetical protein P8M60_00350 [Flavobacteriaceae bacterium]|nr:hypothetical protein [Flavobacteriaceae bacterium]
MYLTKNLFYSLFALLFIVACSKDDDVEITGLDFTISANADDALQVDVLPTANGAATYDVYFDAVGAPTSFVSTTGDAVTSSYPEAAATYTIKVIAKNINGALDVELTKSHTVDYIAPRSIANFEGSDNVTLIAASSEITALANPDASEANSSSNVGQVVTTGDAYEAFIFAPNTTINMTQSDNQVVKMDFWQENAEDVILLAKLEGQPTTDSAFLDVEVEVTASEAGWQTVSFDFGNNRRNSYPNGDAALADLGNYYKVVFFIGFGTNTTGTYYVDNITGGSDGTAVPDTDGDTVVDSIDTCPNDAGEVDNDGCPATSALPSDDFEGNGNIDWNANNLGTLSGDANLITEANPSSTGINTSANAAKYEDYGAGAYANVSFDVLTPFDLSSDNIITVKVFVPTPSTAFGAPAQLELKLQDKTSSEPWNGQVSVIQSYTYDTWQTLTFDFSDHAAATNFSRVVVQFNGENNNEAVTAYIDDFVMGSGN